VGAERRALEGEIFFYHDTPEGGVTFIDDIRGLYRCNDLKIMTFFKLSPVITSGTDLRL
jgi:hypothetical protein